MRNPDYSIYLIADVELLSAYNPIEQILSAVHGGVSIVQIRAKKLSDRDFYLLALAARKDLTPYSVPLIIDDRIDIALAVEADGVHLGQKDLPLKAARRIMGKEKIIGLTANTLEEAKEGEKEGADYLGIGPIFPTTTKENPAPVIGLDKLKIFASRLKIPLVAIGGINDARAAEVKKTGVNGIAVSSFILKSSDPKEAAHLLKKAWNS